MQSINRTILFYSYSMYLLKYHVLLNEYTISLLLSSYSRNSMYIFNLIIFGKIRFHYLYIYVFGCSDIYVTGKTFYCYLLYCCLRKDNFLSMNEIVLLQKKYQSWRQRSPYKKDTMNEIQGKSKQLITK